MKPDLVPYNLAMVREHVELHAEVLAIDLAFSAVTILRTT